MTARKLTARQLATLAVWSKCPTRWLTVGDVRTILRDGRVVATVRSRLVRLCRRGYLSAGTSPAGWLHYRPTPLVDELKERGLLPC